MEASLEEDMQGIGMNGDINDDDLYGDQDDDDDIIYIDDKIPEVFNVDTDLPDVELPEEVAEYINNLSNETKKLEDELKDCDELLRYSPSKAHVSTAVVVYDDLKEIEQAAAEMGMSAEGFQRKVLEDLKQNDFNEEEVDKEYEEFLQLQKEFAELRTVVTAQKPKETPEILAIEAPEDVDNETEVALSWTSTAHESGDAGENGIGEEGQSIADPSGESAALVKYGKDVDGEKDTDETPEAGQIALTSAALTSMRDFILDQLRQNEEWYEKKRQNLVQSIETLRYEEEKEMLRIEERRKRLEDQLNEEKEALRQRRESCDTKLEQELRAKEQETSEELGRHQEEIDRLSEVLEEERQEFERNQKQWQAKLADTRGAAAVKIQKVYRGLRVRKKYSREISELVELRQLRVEERHTLRVMEVEYEMKFREEEAKKAKEEEEKKTALEKKKLEEEEKLRESERKKKEEERMAEEIRKEKARQEEEARLAEIKRKKEEEEERKHEEKKRKEEEKKQKEEEKRLREEEKKKQKEEEKQRKEEEKKRKEEEKRKKEEEKKLKEEEEKKRKQEEKEQKEKKSKEKFETESVHSNGTAEQNVDHVENKKIYENFISAGSESCKAAATTEETNKNGSAEIFASSSNERNSSHLLSKTQALAAHEVPTNGKRPHSSVIAKSPSSAQSDAETINTSETSVKIAHTIPSNKTSTATIEEGATRMHQETQNMVNSATKHSPPSPSPRQQPSEEPEPPSPPTKPSIARAVAQEPTAAATVATSSNAAASFSPLSPLQPYLENPEPVEPKPNPSELQRLAWIKSCIPWSKVSNEPWKLSATTAKVHKKPASAKKLPAVAESVVLAAAHAETLRQVSSVTLCELPGCSLSTLGQCWSLRYLTVTHCSLLCLDGLSQCRHLLYINAEHNHIEYVDLKDLGSLQVVRLAHNNLSSVHGLEGCINLRWLDVSHNSITRIGPGLSALRRLHTLDLSHNQLVSSQGLDCVVTCQRLLLDHNYLQSVDCLEKMCLLMELSLAANNLLKVPELKNQVLLQCLNVEENSIKTLEGLANCWLPLLTTVSCAKNLIESCDGLDNSMLLESLDIGSNQIVDLKGVTSHLGSKKRLSRLVVRGNPFVDVCGEMYSAKLANALPSLTTVDSLPVKPDQVIKEESPDSGELVNLEFAQMCLSQVRLHSKLKAEFERNIQTLLRTKSGASETLCGTYFSLCDTSFKMASEHRSAHEYGDISVSRSIGHFAPADHTNLTSIMDSKSGEKASMLNGQADGSNKTVNRTTAQLSGAGRGHSILDKKALFDQAVLGQSSNASVGDSLTARSSLSESRTSSDTLTGMNTLTKRQGKPQQQAPKHISSHATPSHQGHSLHKHKSVDSKALPGKASFSSRNTKTMTSAGFSSDSDSDSDVGSDLYGPGGGGGSARALGGYTYAPHPPGTPPVVSYANEKDKFEMALNSNASQVKSPISEIANANQVTPFPNGSPYMSERDRFEMALKKPTVLPEQGGKEKFNTALQSTANSTSTSAKDKFNSALQKGRADVSSSHRPGIPAAGVPANIVGSQLADMHSGLDDEFDLAVLGLDGDLDLDSLDFDIDKYLDMEGLDEFLEKGWRPEDSPQIPHSNYPVLGKINPAGDSSAATTSHMITSNNNSGTVRGKPPHHPTLAWRNSPSAELRGRPLQSPSAGVGGQAGVTAHPAQLSPSPSSVASAAETLGGGTVKSKKDELLDEWGFKDSRTAEMMIARAKKMKWNAERRKKLSKLDPQQRLHLFRKLEESGKIQTVRPPPARVLPRKEYFQAREDEAQRQNLERQVEEQTKVHRTFEWLHTQVGDHPIGSSRINAGQALVYAMNEASSGRQMAYKATQDYRKWSPGSDHLDSVSQTGSRPQQGRRYSIGDSQYSGQTPSLPPIQVGSAPSSHKGERISFRDNPVEKSGGWGGGKRRGNYK
ncbi:leucine-rich repeat and iq domain-containing protein 1-like [Plakobranchus ocellatus]|uniref:Leucine-rich repeat and iq domain-containing protein 1-like n=1 Tax=Plakobranchus ocellatus TaxID=259542 RepID=A0AAV4DHD9_9GAST|nr:leucine-rich repeat and iq domain-containing protein 1-like [Plakobranchus ocellatus]